MNRYLQSILSIKIIRTFTLLFFLCLILPQSLPAKERPGKTDLLLKILVQQPDQQIETVQVSIPVSILPMIYPCLPKELRLKSEQYGLTLPSLLQELQESQSEAIAQIEGPDIHIKVWLESARPENKADCNFVKVKIQEKGSENPKIDLNIPTGWLILSLQSILSGLKF